MRVRIPELRFHSFVSADEASERIPWHIADYGIDRTVWPRTQGEGVLWGIVDTGVDKQHAESGDLAGRIVEARDFTRSRTGWEDAHGHGSHVAGIMGAVHGNNQGGAGVAPKIRLVCAKGLGDDGSGDDRGIEAALDYLGGMGVWGVNMSLGSSQRSERIIAAVERLLAAGIHVVCASGNAGPRQPNWPALHPGVVSVAASDQSNRIAEFSSPSSVDVAAPGVRIESCYRFGAYAVLSGTSMSAPYVAASIALAQAFDAAAGRPRATPSDILLWLKGYAADVGPIGPDERSGAGILVPKPEMFPPGAVDPVEPPPGPESASLTFRLPDGRTVAANLPIQRVTVS